MASKVSDNSSHGCHLHNELEDPDKSAWLGVFLVEPGFAVTDGFQLSGNQTFLGKRY
jgi:hypothetical protein